jgi:hypothetical protein
MTNDRLQFLRTWLEHQYCESDKVVQLIKTIQLRCNKIARPNEYNKIKDFQNSKLCEVFTDDVIALVLEAKSKKRTQKGTPYQPFLHVCDFESNRVLKKTLLFHFKQTIPFHFDLIVKSGAHCTAVQLDFDGNDFRVYYLDAAGSFHNEPFMEEMSKLTNPHFVITKRLRIQRDNKSCAIYSIQHLNKLSHLKITEKEKLPAVFFKHSQTSTFFKEAQYNEQPIHKNTGTVFKDHINQYSIFTKEGKKTNYSILFQRDKYLAMALELLALLEQTMAPRDIEQVLDARMRLQDKNIISVASCSSLRALDTVPPAHVVIQEASLINIDSKPQDTESLKKSGYIESKNISMSYLSVFGMARNVLDSCKFNIFFQKKSIILLIGMILWVHSSQWGEVVIDMGLAMILTQALWFNSLIKQIDIAHNESCFDIEDPVRLCRHAQ